MHLSGVVQHVVNILWDIYGILQAALQHCSVKQLAMSQNTENVLRYYQILLLRAQNASHKSILITLTPALQGKSVQVSAWYLLGPPPLSREYLKLGILGMPF